MFILNNKLIIFKKCFYDKLGEEGMMEQYTTTSGDQIVVQAANGQVQQQVRANVNRLLFNQLLLIWKKYTECGFYLFFDAFLNLSKL